MDQEMQMLRQRIEFLEQRLFEFQEQLFSLQTRVAELEARPVAIPIEPAEITAPGSEAHTGTLKGFEAFEQIGDPMHVIDYRKKPPRRVE